MAVKFPVGVIEEGSLSLTRNLWNAWDFVFALFCAIIVAGFYFNFIYIYFFSFKPLCVLTMPCVSWLCLVCLDYVCLILCVLTMSCVS